MMKVAAICAVALVFAGFVAVSGQVRDTPVPRPSTGTGSIAGRVTTGGTEKTIVPHAQLMIVGVETAFLQVIEADDQGKFTFTNLPAGRYAIGGSKPPLMNTWYGATRSGRSGTKINVSEGQRVTGLEFVMLRGGVVSGLVTDERGQPLPNVTVRLIPVVQRGGEWTLRTSSSTAMMIGLNEGLNTSTDDRGMYRMFGVAPGDYLIGSATPNGPSEVHVLTAAEIQAGIQAVRDASQPARPGAMGPPAPFIPSTQSTGSPVTNPAPRPMPVPASPTYGLVPFFFPGTPDISQAVPVKVTAGEERSGIDIRTEAVPLARIDGVVLDVRGEAASNIVVSLRPRENSTLSAPGFLPSPSVRVVGAGEFSLTNVPPGRYTLSARSTPGAPARGAPPLPEAAAAPAQQPQVPPVPQWASLDLYISGIDMTGVVLAMQPALTVSGKVVIKSYGTQPPKNPRMTVAIRPPQAEALFSSFLGGGTSVKDDGTFAVDGLIPGRYAVGAAIAPQGPESIGAVFTWTVESVMLDGKDITDLPLDLKPADAFGQLVITLSDRTQQVVGTLVDSSKRPAPDYTVVLFSTDPRHWVNGSRRIQTARPATDGRFEFTPVGGLPPGSYYLAALTDLGPDDQYDSALLTELSKGAIKFTLAPGETRREELRIR